MIRLLWMAAGALLNRVRGGLFDFGGNKLLFPLLLCLPAISKRRFAYLLPPMWDSNSDGEPYIGALFGTAPSQAEVPQIDEIVEFGPDNAAR